MNKTYIIIFILAVLGSQIACNNSASSEYKKMEERELASGVRQDSLFLGLYLGMSSKDFYDHCWKMNKQGIIREGATNTTVLYPISDFSEQASMEFYPRFEGGKITAMPLTFAYNGWSPWNKHLFAEHLILEVKSLMEKWYGEGFVEIENPNPIGSNAWVKVDGNRRISIYYVDDSKVSADIVDLIALKASEDAKK